MKSHTSVILLAVAALALCTSLVSAAIVCTPQTCAGPVVYTFSGNGNCSGTPTITQKTDGTTPLGSCLALSGASHKYTCDSNGGFVEIQYTDSECTNVLSATAYATGQCFSLPGADSYVYKCNVNDTYAAISHANSGYPTFAFPTNQECYSPNNCTDLNPAYYITYYTSDTTTCPANNATSSYAYLASANYSIGGCYAFDEARNIQFDCSEDYLTGQFYQNPNGCSGKPIYAVANARNCVLQNNDKRDAESDEISSLFASSSHAFVRDLALSVQSYKSIVCTPNVVPTAPTPVAVPSAASPLVQAPKILLGLLALLGLLLTL